MLVFFSVFSLSLSLSLSMSSCSFSLSICNLMPDNDPLTLDLPLSILAKLAGKTVTAITGAPASQSASQCSSQGWCKDAPFCNCSRRRQLATCRFAAYHLPLTTLIITGVAPDFNSDSDCDSCALECNAKRVSAVKEKPKQKAKSRYWNRYNKKQQATQTEGSSSSSKNKRWWRGRGIGEIRSQQPLIPHCFSCVHSTDA